MLNIRFTFSPARKPSFRFLPARAVGRFAPFPAIHRRHAAPGSRHLFIFAGAPQQSGCVLVEALAAQRSQVTEQLP